MRVKERKSVIKKKIQEHKLILIREKQLKVILSKETRTDYVNNPNNYSTNLIIKNTH